MNRPRPATRALAHPLWWAALALLAVNDHLFKGAGVLPQPVVGKLSDVAGMFVAPALLAALLAVRTRRGLLLSHLAVGAVFAGINLSPAFAGAFAALTALTPWPWTIYVDPTDLAVLPLLAVSHRLFADWCARPVPVKPVLLRGGLALGSVACMATSPPPEHYVEEEPPPPPPTVFPSVQASLVIANDLPRQQVVRVRALRPEVDIDCNTVEDPTRALTRAHFAPAQAWLLDPGRAFSVVPADGRACRAALVDGPELPLRLIWLRAGDYPLTELPTDTATAVPERTIFIGRDGSGWSDHPALGPPPPAEPEAADDACVLPAGRTLDWTEPPLGRWTVEQVETGADGCRALHLAGAADPDRRTRWFLCAPLAVTPWAPGEEIRIEQVLGPHEGVRLTGPHGTLVVARGQTPVPEQLVGWDAAPASDCVPRHDTCGGLVQPLTVTVADHALRAGDSVALPDGTTLHLVRAGRALVVDHACDEAAFIGADLYEVILTAEEEE